MIGPSSSHTAGAVRLGRVARQLLGSRPERVELTLYAIPSDEFVETMREVGNAMPEKHRETAKGGLAATPTGRKIMDELYRNSEGKELKP